MEIVFNSNGDRERLGKERRRGEREEKREGEERGTRGERERREGVERGRRKRERRERTNKFTEAYIIDKFVDTVVISITGPCSIVCAALKRLYVLQRSTTSLKKK